MASSFCQFPKLAALRPRFILSAGLLVATLCLNFLVCASRGEDANTPKAPSVPKSSPPAWQSDQDDLAEKRQTLLGEVRYAKAKLEAARQQLATLTAAGDVDKAEHADQEVKDWQARYSSAAAQLDEVEKEIARSPQGPPYSLPADKVIDPGEELEVFVNEDPSFNGIYQVRRGGYIIMPQVGRIVVAGKTLSAAEAAVKRALQGSQLKNASVIIERKHGANIDDVIEIPAVQQPKNPQKGQGVLVPGRPPEAPPRRVPCAPPAPEFFLAALDKFKPANPPRKTDESKLPSNRKTLANSVE